ncbi:MAG: hypothetical protein EBR02_07915 [Alphaproteobacteria bacterium]|nr:hypothetical protein [Alphaproteobacteria bacterium]
MSFKNRLVWALVTSSAIALATPSLVVASDGYSPPSNGTWQAGPDGHPVGKAAVRKPITPAPAVAPTAMSTPAVEPAPVAVVTTDPATGVTTSLIWRKGAEGRPLSESQLRKTHSDKAPKSVQEARKAKARKAADEKNRLQKEQEAKDALEKARIEREQAENQRLEQERIAKENAAKAQAEAAKLPATPVSPAPVAEAKSPPPPPVAEVKAPPAPSAPTAAADNAEPLIPMEEKPVPAAAQKSPSPPPPPVAAVKAPSAPVAPVAAKPELPKPEAATESSRPALRIVFKPTETAVPLSIKDNLNEVITRLKTNADERVTLIAYASSLGEQASTSRRVSLSRALSVRGALIDQGIAPLRINVLAEGDKNPGGEPDRVDIFVRTSTDKK